MRPAFHSLARPGRSLRHFLPALLLLITLPLLQACEESGPPVSERIVGVWNMKDPAGQYISSQMRFGSDGAFEITDRLQGQGGQTLRREVQGRYSIDSDGHLSMTAYGLEGGHQERDFKARIDENGVLHMGFGGGSIAYGRSD